MSDDNNEGVTECQSLSKTSAFSFLQLDSDIEARVAEAVSQILISDERFCNADIEVVDAVTDWVRAEAVIRIAFENYLKNKGTSSDERMFRSALIHKNALRDEIFGKYKDRQSKKDELTKANQILIDSRVIEANTEVDILED